MDLLPKISKGFELGIYIDIIFNFLLAYLIAMMILATIVIVEELDRRRGNSDASKVSQLAVRILLLLPTVGAGIIVPTTVWRNVSWLYSDIGVATFLVSLVVLVSCVVAYRIRASKGSND